MKKTKRILTVILGLVSLFCFAFSAGCGEVDPLTVDKTPSGSSGLVFEYMTDREIPVDIFSGITESDVNDGKVTFVFTSPEYSHKGETVQDVYTSKFPAVYCDVVGEWKVTFVKGKSHDTKTFAVKDTIKPEFEVASRAYDVWFDAIVDENGEITDKGTRYSLPMIFPDDLSEFDYDTMEQTLTLDKDIDSEEDELVKVTILSGDRYYAPGVGKMTYTISISDIHGNNNSYTVSWNVKDPTWRDNDLENGYLADYDEIGYINSVYSGNMSSYWLGSEITESYLDKDEFTAETGVEANSGVVKVTAKPTDGYAVGAFGFRLSKDLTKEDVAGKYLVVKFYTPNNVSTVRYGCKTWQTKGNPSRNVEAVHSIVIDVNPGQWNYAVISTAMLNEGYFSLGDTVINEYQIAFGERTQSVQDDEIILYVDEVALAEKLPDITGFSISGKVISWDKIEGATAYEVTEDGNTVNVTTNSYTATDPDCVITVRALSDSARYLSADYATTFINTANFGEYDLALFDSDSYESIVTKSTRAHRVAKSVEAEILDSYEGATDVLKVVTTAKAGGIADFRIKLPRECSEGITVRFMIKSSPANFFYWMNPSLSEDKSISDSANILANQELGDLAGQWQVVYIPYSSSETVKDVIEVLVLDNVNKAENGVTEVYFDEIMSGDRRCDFRMSDLTETLDNLAADLPEGYLADFSSKDYEKLAGVDTYYNNHVAESVTAEYVANFKGFTDLLKITTENNDKTFGNFTLFLPKAMTEGGYTVRFYMETTSNAALRIGNPHTEIAPGTGDIIKEYHPLSLVNGLWTEVYIPYTGEHTREITFQIWGGADGVNTFYIDYVADGDRVEQMAAEREQAMADALPEGYLADFSSELYEARAVLSGSPNTAQSLVAEYIESYTDASGLTDTNVLKVTAKAASNGRGNITIKLPKASTSGVITVKYMVPECNSTYNGFIDPGTNADLVSSQFTASTTWQYIVLNQTAVEKDCIEVLFANGGAVTNVVYFACVVEGDQTAALKEQDMQAAQNQILSGLEDGELANFSSALYLSTIGDSKYSSSLKATSLTAEYEDSFEGADGVVKITTVNNEVGSKFGGFSIELPKDMPTDSGFTIKFYIASTGSRALRIINPASDSVRVSSSHEWVDATLDGIVGKWQTIYVPYSETYADPGTVEFMFFMNKTSGVSGTNIIYIDSIVAGNQTA